MPKEDARTAKGVFVSLVFSLYLASLAVAEVKTDLQKEGFIGPVQTVQIQTAQFSSQSGQWVEGPRELVALISYNARGNKTEVIPGPIGTGVRWLVEGIPLERTIYTYDLQGKLTAEVSYNSDGSLSRKTVHTHDSQGRKQETSSYEPTGSLSSKTTYTYDDEGKLIEEVSYNSFGLLHTRLFTYDDKGNLTEEEVYGPGGDFKYRSEHTYDDQGRRMATTNYDTRDPALGIEKTVETYDANGNILELTTYYTEKVGDEEDRPIPPPAKRVYTYEFDTHGNWIKQTQTLCTAETGKPVCEPSMVTYRTITYYPEPERPQP
jgi:antitoxin component YwqK of YwqJK toxin-antitoxin module